MGVAVFQVLNNRMCPVAAILDRNALCIPVQYDYLYCTGFESKGYFYINKELELKRSGRMLIVHIFFFLCERESMRMSKLGHRGRGRERENFMQAPHTAQSLMQGLKSGP